MVPPSHQNGPKRHPNRFPLRLPAPARQSAYRPFKGFGPDDFANFKETNRPNFSHAEQLVVIHFKAFP